METATSPGTVFPTAPEAAAPEPTTAAPEPTASKDVDLKETMLNVLIELMEKSPALKQLVERRLSDVPALPFVVRAEAASKMQEGQLDFHAEGKAGEKKWIKVRPEELFRGEKWMMIDTGKTPGMGTRICATFVGMRAQGPVADDEHPGTPTIFFGPSALGNGTRLRTCRLGQSISLLVEFVEDCTFEATLFGKFAFGD